MIGSIPNAGPPVVRIIPSDATAEKLDAHQFVSLLRKSHPDWWPDGCADFEWVFRGHRDAAWKLQPTAWRDGKAEGAELRGLISACKKMQLIRVCGLEWTRQLGLDADEEPKLAEELIVRCGAELEALAHFAQSANSLGFPVATVSERPGEANQINTLHIKEAADQAPRIGPIAQHHGVPTRLLDWTDEPLNAAYFAAGANDDPIPTSAIAVWALNTRIFATNPDWYVRVFDGDRHTNRFLHAQSGRFTQMLHPERFFLDHGRWPHIEEWISADWVHPSNGPRRPYAGATPALKKFVLHQSQVPTLRDLLRREGLSRARVMPTLDNVVSELSRRWTLHR